MFAPQTGSNRTGAAGDSRGLAPVTKRLEGERLELGFSDPAERARILAWLGAGLRPGRPGRLEREYPLCFAPDSKAIAIVGYCGSEPAGFCLLLPTRFVAGSGSLGAGLISFVYTDPSHRRRGLAGRIVARAVSEARAQALGLCMLWCEAGLADFYASQGFTPAGGEALITLDRSILATARTQAASDSVTRGADLRIERAVEADWDAILALRAKRASHVALAGEAKRWLGIPELEVRVARRGSEVVGFAMCGRGDDFAGVIHEWAGETDAVLRCCEALLPLEAGAGLMLLAPRETGPLTWRLRCSGARTARQALAWMRIGCAASLRRDLVSLVPELEPLSITAIEPDRASSPRVRVTRTDTGNTLELGAAEWLETLFGHPSASEDDRAHAIRRSILPGDATSKLPLPLFVWGLESI